MAVQYALIADNGEVQVVVSTGSDEDYVNGEVYHGLTAIAVDSDADQRELVTTKYYNNGWQDRPARTSVYQDWVNYAWVVNDVRYMAEVRRERDALLGGSDWTQVPDSPLSDSQKTHWATYRQALRDVTSATPIVWPVVP